MLPTKLAAAARLMRAGPRAIGNAISARLGVRLQNMLVIDRLEFYLCDQQPPERIKRREGVEFTQLVDQDFSRLRSRSDRFGEQTRLYYDSRGICSAYGVFLDGEIQHISWVYTSSEYTREPYERFRLSGDEKEIVNCFTAEAARGMGLYPYAIQEITKRLLCPQYPKIIMSIEPGNEPSRRGILKAGFKFGGRTFHLRSPSTPKWRGIYLRISAKK